MNTSKIFALLFVIVFGITINTHSAEALSSTLVQSGNLTYLGSFNVPSASDVGTSPAGSLDYGGTALTYNPLNNSLFIVGHPHNNYDAEISIPAIGGTAKTIQKLVDPLVGGGGIGSGSSQIGGQLVYKGKLYLSKFLYYDGTGAQSQSHFSRSLNLREGVATGPTRVGSMGAGFYSGYMGLVPTEWQSAFGGPALTGNCCLSIISRTSYGPALFAFNPESMGTAYPLVYYPQAHQTLGLYGASGVHPIFNGTTRIAGVVFPEGTASVLFFGVSGVGNYCYGEAAACNDPSNNSKGEHAYPYKTYVWAYNANDLAQVKSGTKQPWDVVPYSTWEIPQMNGKEGFSASAGYDPKTQKIYLAEKCALTGCMPRIHVFQINNATTVNIPTPTTTPTPVITPTPEPVSVVVPTPPTTTVPPTNIILPTQPITSPVTVPTLPTSTTPVNTPMPPAIPPNPTTTNTTTQPPAQTDTTFAIGKKVRTTDTVRVRESAGGRRLGFQWRGREGVIVGGPVIFNNHTWWKINYKFGTDGWSSQSLLKVVLTTKDQNTANILQAIINLQDELMQIQLKLQYI